VNTRYPRSKAGAINYAAEVTESPYLAVFDADEAVHPDFVSGAVARLADHDVVQGRTVPQPTGAVEAIAYYESLLLSYASRRLLYLVTGFRMAASRAVVMRRGAFEAVGGYDQGMLTEDFDFAYRCYRERLDVTEYLAAPSRIDAAHTIRDWWGQRKRWMTGYAQVLHRLLLRIDPTDYRSVLSAAICAGTVIGPALLLSVLSKFAVLFVVGANGALVLSLFSEYSMHYAISPVHVSLVPIVAVIVSTAAVHLHDYRTGAVRKLDRHLPAVPLLFPLYGLAALKAVIEYFVSWDGEWYAAERDPDRF
jgi:cellulose synthase/poly-beta-1,6-N-acetylglucosamine synthase-like glycosyltransferase